MIHDDESMPIEGIAGDDGLTAPESGATPNGVQKAELSLPALEAITWTRSYDRQSVDRFLAEIEAQRAGLLRDVERASARRDAALELVAGRTTAAAAALGAIVIARSSDVAKLEEEHQEVIATIRSAAETEAARILTVAEREVAAMHEATAAMVALAAPSSTAPVAPEAEIDRRAYQPVADAEGHASAG